MAPLTNGDYRGKTVLVTGGTGFVGGRLAERLILEEHAQVRVLVRNWNKAVWISRTPVELVPGTMLDPAALEQACQGVQIVFHCASGGNSDAEYLRTNIDGTRFLLEAAKKAGAERFVFVSSIAVHGPAAPDNANESAPYESWNRGYSDSKIAAEKLVLQFGKEHNLAVTILRPTFIWGPRSHLFTVRPLRAMRDNTFRLIDHGQGDCHAVYVDNLVDALLLAGIRPEAIGEPFLITDGYGITWKTFFEEHARWLGRTGELPSLSGNSNWSRFSSWAFETLGGKLQRWQGNPAPLWRKICRRSARIVQQALERRGAMNRWDVLKFARVGRLDTSKAREKLGYQPRWDFPSALQDTHDWVHDQLGYELRLGERLEQKSTLQEIRT